MKYKKKSKNLFQNPICHHRVSLFLSLFSENPPHSFTIVCFISINVFRYLFVRCELRHKLTEQNYSFCSDILRADLPQFSEEIRSSSNFWDAALKKKHQKSIMRSWGFKTVTFCLHSYVFVSHACQFPPIIECKTVKDHGNSPDFAGYLEKRQGGHRENDETVSIIVHEQKKGEMCAAESALIAVWGTIRVFR